MSQSLAKSETSLYHGTKSVLSDRFGQSEYTPVQTPAAIVIELSPLIRTQAIKALSSLSLQVQFIPASKIFQRDLLGAM